MPLVVQYGFLVLGNTRWQGDGRVSEDIRCKATRFNELGEIARVITEWAQSFEEIYMAMIEIIEMQS